MFTIDDIISVSIALDQTSFRPRNCRTTAALKFALVYLHLALSLAHLISPYWPYSLNALGQ